jgi:DNA-binding CsgD family transcriptional regulator/uncharacterized membrane protein YidH (DUF202 family)
VNIKTIIIVITFFVAHFSYSHEEGKTLAEYTQNISKKYSLDLSNLNIAIKKLDSIKKTSTDSIQIEFEKGVLELVRGGYVQSIHSFTKYLDTKKSMSDKAQVCDAQRMLATAYTQLGYKEKALNLYRICLNYHVSKKQNKFVAAIYNNLSSLYLQKNEYDSVLYYLFKAISADSSDKNSFLYLSVKTNFILVYSRKGLYEKAYQSYKEIIHNPELKKYSFLYYLVQINVVLPLLHFKKYDSAQVCFENAEEYLFEKQLYETALYRYNDIMPYYYSSKQYEKLFKYQQRWKISYDSISKQNDKTLLQKLELEKLEQEKERINQLLNLQKIKSRQKNLIIVLLMMSVALVVSAALNYYRKLNLKRIQETQLLQKKLLIELQSNQTLMQQQIKHLQENEKLKDYINSQLEQEVQQRTEHLIQKEREILKLKEEQIKAEKEKTEREALTQTLLLQQKNQVFEAVQKSIEVLFQSKDLTPVQEKKLKDTLHIIKQNLNLEQQWESFKTFFEANYPAFMEEISEKYPQLTQNDIRHIAYAKMGLSTKEIANIMNIEAKSVRMARYRIKQKLNPESDKTLYELLNEI